MIKIYFIVDIYGLVYVGATKKELNERMRQHKYNKKKDYLCSSKLLDLDNCYIECIEECNEDMRKERERYWINYIDCVNVKKLTYNDKNYYECNKEHYKKQREKNKEKKKEYDRLYYQNIRKKNKYIKISRV